jgi:glutaredoxin
MRVEVLTSPACPHRDATDRVLQQALLEVGLPADTYEVILVADFEDAKVKRSLGAPTIRVNGMDIEYADREPEEYTAGCRFYNTMEGWKPVPPLGMLLRALKDALASER